MPPSSSTLRNAIGAASLLPALLACGAEVPWDGGRYPEPSMHVEPLVRASTFDKHPDLRRFEGPLPSPARLVEERLAKTDAGALIDDLSFDGGESGPLRDGGVER